MRIAFYFWLCFAGVAGWAAPFVNLDFESANTNTSQIENRYVGGINPGSYTFGTGPAADLFPGWTVFMNGTPSNFVAIGNGYYHWPTPGSIPGHAALAIPGPYFSFLSASPVEGNYSLRIDLTRDANGFTPVYLSQRGDVPTNAHYLVIHLAGGNPAEVSFDGQFFPRSAWNPYPGDPYRSYVDVSAWAGKTVTLIISPGDETGCVVDGLEFVGSDPLKIDSKLHPPSGGGFSFSWIGELATKYQVESSTNINVSWQAIGMPVTSTNRIYLFTDTTVTNQPSSQRFYRLHAVP